MIKKNNLKKDKKSEFFCWQLFN